MTYKRNALKKDWAPSRGLNDVEDE